jgi:hypothetical protein
MRSGVTHVPDLVRIVGTRLHSERAAAVRGILLARLVAASIALLPSPAAAQAIERGRVEDHARELVALLERSAGEAPMTTGFEPSRRLLAQTTAWMDRHALPDSLRMIRTRALAERMTSAEIAAALAFYRSPLGIKLFDALGVAPARAAAFSARFMDVHRDEITQMLLSTFGRP